MRVTFQADADLDARILRGLKRIAPEIDFRSADEAGLTALADIDVLRLAAAVGRILVSQDRRTMPGHLQKFIEEANSPGVILLRERITISAAIDEIALIWSASEPDEWINRLVWIPL